MKQDNAIVFIITSHTQVKDGELDTEEAQNTCQQQELALSTRKHILNAKHEEQKALATHCEGKHTSTINLFILFLALTVDFFFVVPVLYH